MTDDLITWLRAQLDDDERVALAAPRRNWMIYLAGDPATDEVTEQRVLDHVARHDPARVLAEVDAKRKIIEQCEVIADLSQDSDTELAGWVLRALAAPYANREGWKP